MAKLKLRLGITRVHFDEASEHEPAQAVGIKDRFKTEEIQEWRPVLLVIDKGDVAS
jgi:hypothetical protein